MINHQPVRIVYRGYRELGRGGKIVEHDGAFPSVNDIGISGRVGKKPNWPYKNAKALFTPILLALFSEPTGTEFEFIKPGTQTTKIIVPIERDGEMPQPAKFILVEGKCYWPTRHLRDAGNYEAIISKFVADDLQTGGYIEGDDWTRFAFGNLERGWASRSSARTELTFLPGERHELVDEDDSV